MNTKRIISALLALIMLCSILPLGVSAAWEDKVDEEGNPLEEPRTPQMKFTMQLPKQVPAMSMIRRSVDLSAK